MFKRAKQKIVISILAILCAVIVGTLGMIYISSYLSVSSQNYEVLQKHMEMLVRDGNFQPNNNSTQRVPDDIGQFADNIPNQGKLKRGLEIGTFYTVKFSSDGTNTVIENGANTIYTDEELISLAEKVILKERGSTGELLYMVRSNNGNTYVSFMDNTVFTESFAKLFVFTLVFGLTALIAITFISISIANRIVAPMEETYKKQKQFTADAGHELKTPIAAVSANIEILRREIGENKWLENITYENERMRKLVTELLELARNENRTIEKKLTDVSRLVSGAILPFEAAAFEKNIIIETDIADGIMANIDENSIHQLVTILIDNGVSHTKSIAGEMGKVSVTLSEKKGVSVLSVSNAGEEIPQSELDNLFVRFYRGDSSHEFTGHYGLGLAIAKAISDANNTKLSVACQNGLVTFSVTFPLK